MAVKRITVHCVEIEDVPGSLHKLLSDIASKGVDLLCLAAASTGEGKGCVCLSGKDPAGLSSCLSDFGLSATEATGFIVSGDDKAGAAAEGLKPLAEAGINGVTGSAMVFEGQYQVLVVVKAADGDAAAAAMGV